MKNLITSMACIMILLVFVLQFTQNQILHNRITAVDQAVNNFREIVKQEGCVSQTNRTHLQEELAGILKCTSSDIRIQGDQAAVRRGQLVEYRVEVPVRDIITMPQFWNIDESENQFSYTIHRFTTSEYIGR
ncbi:MAG: hypothetical protein ACI4LA_10220 [Emergencia sp.]